MMTIPRLIHRIYAYCLGYFWIPCKNCGEYHGGHEKSGTVWRNGNWRLGTMVCEKCAKSLGLRNIS